METYLPRGTRTEGGVRTNNAREFAVAQSLEDEGWTVFKKGWPDFLAYRDGEIRLVEVKPPNHNLKKHQAEVANIMYEITGVQTEILGRDIE